MVPASLFSFLLGGPDIVFHMIKLLHRHAKEQTILCSTSEYVVVNSKGMYLAVGEGIEVEYVLYKMLGIAHVDCLHLPIHITI